MNICRKLYYLWGKSERVDFSSEIAQTLYRSKKTDRFTIGSVTVNLTELSLTLVSGILIVFFISALLFIVFCRQRFCSERRGEKNSYTQYKLNYQLYSEYR